MEYQCGGFDNKKQRRKERKKEREKNFSKTEKNRVKRNWTPREQRWCRKRCSNRPIALRTYNTRDGWKIFVHVCGGRSYNYEAPINVCSRKRKTPRHELVRAWAKKTDVLREAGARSPFVVRVLLAVYSVRSSTLRTTYTKVSNCTSTYVRKRSSTYVASYVYVHSSGTATATAATATAGAADAAMATTQAVAPSAAPAATAARNQRGSAVSRLSHELSSSLQSFLFPRRVAMRRVCDVPSRGSCACFFGRQRCSISATLEHSSFYQFTTLPNHRATDLVRRPRGGRRSQQEIRTNLHAFYPPHSQL